MRGWNRVRGYLLLGWLWICALGASLLVSAQNAYHWSMQVEEYAYGCDSFGYLQMARAVRRAAAQQELPAFHLESLQTRLLVERMQADKLPLVSWDEVVAPHAHHYFPNSDHVGVQYPPGTALALALFPEGRAVHGLCQTAIGVLLGIAAVALVLAGIKQAWAAGGFVALTIHLGLGMLARIWNMSFSINAVLIPLTLSCLCVFAALGLRARASSGRAVWLLAFLGGCLFGLAILIRLPVVLLAPGFLVLLWYRSWRPGVPAIAFGLAMMLVGIIPFLVHQQRLTGAWYLPTYPPHDTSPPSFERLPANLSYYLGNGPGSEDNWAPGILVIGVLGLIVRRGRSNPAPSGLGWTRPRG